MGRLLGTLFYVIAVITVAVGTIAALGANPTAGGLVFVWAVAGAVPSAFFGFVCFALSDIADAVKRSADYARRQEERSAKAASVADSGFRMGDAKAPAPSGAKPEQKFRGRVAG